MQNSCSLQAIFPLVILLILWAVFSFPLSVTHAGAVISPGKAALSQIFSPKIQQGAIVSQISSLELPTTAPDSGNFSDSIEIVTCIREGNTWNINHASQFWREERGMQTQNWRKASAMHIVPAGYQAYRIDDRT